MKLYKYRIRWMNEPLHTDYIVHAKDAIDARVMAEVWQKRWQLEGIQEITCEGEVSK